MGLDDLDDRVLHFTMSPDHDCKDGVCSDGDFMLTDIPDFANVSAEAIFIFQLHSILCSDPHSLSKAL